MNNQKKFYLVKKDQSELSKQWATSDSQEGLIDIGSSKSEDDADREHGVQMKGTTLKVIRQVKIFFLCALNYLTYRLNDKSTRHGKYQRRPD